MPAHSIYLDEDTPLCSGELTITGDEAQHAARVKRITPGDRVRVLDGRGHAAEASVAATGKHRGEWQLTIRVESVQEAPRVKPRVEVLSAVPKGSHLSDIIDGLSQVGAASWAPLRTRRGEVDPRPGKLERLERTAMEACKQCGRAWRLELGPETSLAGAIAGPDAWIVLADATGAAYTPSVPPRHVVRVLIGPEGGWTPDELLAARTVGVQIARFGPHVMRIQTAAVIAAGQVLAAETRNPGS